MGLAGIFFLAMLPLVLRHLDPVTGDEPFYLMTAISVVRDGDLDESNNYANRDYEEFYPPDPLPSSWQGWPAFPRTLPPHPAITEQEGLYSKHGLGLTLLVALPYELGGRTGAVLVVMAFAILLAGQMYLLAREAGSPEPYALLVAVGLAIAMPLAPYATLIFPEIPAALLIIYALRRLTAPINGTGRWLLTGAAIGFLPWLHQRFAVISVVLTLALLFRLWQSRSWSAATAFVPIAAGAASIAGYNIWLYGQLTQNVEDHAGFSGLSGALNGAAGLLLDAQWGLLIAAPAMLFGIATLPHWWHAGRQRTTLAIAATLPYLIVVAAYNVWWGEWGPPARYLVPVIPLLAGPLGAWVHSARRPAQLAFGATWVVGMLLTLIGFANPQRFYHHPDGINNLVSIAGQWLGIDLAGALTAYQPYALSPLQDRVLWSVVTLAVLSALTVWLNSEHVTGLRIWFQRRGGD